MQFHLSFLLHGSAGRSISPTCSDADENVGDRVGGANDQMPSLSFAFTVLNHPSKVIFLLFSFGFFQLHRYFVNSDIFLYTQGTLSKPCTSWEDHSLQSAINPPGKKCNLQICQWKISCDFCFSKVYKCVHFRSIALNINTD